MLFQRQSLSSLNISDVSANSLHNEENTRGYHDDIRTGYNIYNVPTETNQSDVNIQQNNNSEKTKSTNGTTQEDILKATQILKGPSNILLGGLSKKMAYGDEANRSMFDVVVLASEADYRPATEFINQMRHYIQLQPVPVNIILDTYYNGCNENAIGRYSDFYDRSLFLFVFVSDNYSKCGELNRYIGETVLVDGIVTSPATRDRVVPIWTTAFVWGQKNRPFEFKALRGVEYFRFLQQSSDTNCFQMMQEKISHKRNELNVNLH